MGAEMIRVTFCFPGFMSRALAVSYTHLDVYKRQGACWAFAGISSVESNLLSEGKASAGIDLSEKAATWFTYQAQNTTP